ncbi:MAG: CDP-diacylglycerol--glycerol-3-phosphate 3-phosphatidyltransferase [Clostridia bacterium]|nr:CDP-diacylglycerol--glycerol-3-phosphate 3-phosphatidyltransferase [Clostridia bacterium]
MSIDLNLPNKLTIFRIVLAPVFLFLFFAEFIPYNHIFALIVFVVAVITDFADGKIARCRNLVTNFGKIADPIADKILTTITLLCFMQKNLCSIWVILIIITREFAVSGIRITAAAQGSVIPANIYGKVKTVMQMIFSIIILLLLAIQSGIDFIFPHFEIISEVMMWILAIVTLVSGAIYIKDSAKIIDFSK